MKEISVTREIKSTLSSENKKIIKKITKTFDDDFGEEMYIIYFKEGVISAYSCEEMNNTASFVRQGYAGVEGMINEMVLR